MQRSRSRHLFAVRTAMGTKTAARTRKRHTKLVFEPLEDRRVLAASLGDLPDLAVDTAAHRAASLIVQFREGTNTPGSLAAHAATTKLDEEWALTPGMRRVELDPSSDWASVLDAYRRDPNVLFAEPDYRVSLNVLPNDPDFGSQYALDNTGYNNALLDADIDAPEAWDVTTGSHSTIVAVIDTGVDYTHPDLAANIWTNEGEIPGNGIDDDKNGYVDDIHGWDFANNDNDPMDDHFHGTHVAGTIGAVGDNEVGVTGVNWHVSIMALKFLDANGGGYTSDAIAALNYAVANGAVVSNNSWGGGGYEAAFETALKNAQAKGHIFVAAAGNDGWDNDRDAFYPAGYKDRNDSKTPQNIISVAATDDNDQLAWFSNYGKKSVDLAAPGVNILSTFPTKMTPAMREDGFTTYYGSISGTSMATPHVTGVVALVRSLHPDWSYDRVIDQVLNTVDVVDGAADTFTQGRLNAAAAVGNAAPDTAGPRIVSTDPSGSVVGAVSRVRVQFSEAIDPLTFTLEDVVSITGPENVTINPIAVTPVAASSRQFDITFLPQTVLGDYSLVIGSDITDVAGNLMDQDRDGTGGESEDGFTATFTISDNIGFHALDTPLDIDNLNSLFGTYTESTISVGSNINISDLNVQLNIWFPYDGDLEIVLISPRGTQVKLSSYRGGEGGDFLDTIFDDEASTPIGNGSAPFLGSYRPENRLSVFDGQSAQGDWTLRIIADFNIDHFLDGTGILNDWSLDLAGSGSPGDPNDPPPPPPPPPPPGNRAPVAVPDSLNGDVNTRLAVPAAQLLANDSDPDGDTLAIVAVGSPVGGEVGIRGDLVTFTPDPDFTGAASFQYFISDGFLMSFTTVSVNIQQTSQWSNPTNVYDVNNDGLVVAGDVLDVINVINAIGSTPLESLSIAGIGSGKYLDVTGDSFLAPNDALAVINYINAHPNGTGTLNAGSNSAVSSLANANDAALLGLLGIDMEAAFGRGRRK